MNEKRLIDGCIVFDPTSSHLYKLDAVSLSSQTKYELGENSKDILVLLIESCGQYVSTEELLEQVWREKKNVEVDVTSVRQAVSKLRKTLKLIEPEVEVIKTVPKKGYCLSVKVEPIKDDLNPKNDSGIDQGKVTRKFLLYTFFVIWFVVIATYYSSSHMSKVSVFSKMEDIGIYNNKVKILQNKHHPVDKELLPLFKKCLSELLLDLNGLDSIIIYSTAEGVFSLTVLYGDINKKVLTYRLILTGSSNKERVKCVLQ